MKVRGKAFAKQWTYAAADDKIKSIHSLIGAPTFSFLFLSLATADELPFDAVISAPIDTYTAH